MYKAEQILQNAEKKLGVPAAKAEVHRLHNAVGDAVMEAMSLNVPK